MSTRAAVFCLSTAFAGSSRLDQGAYRMHADGSPDACLYREPKGKDDRNFRLRMRLFPDAEITPGIKDDDDDVLSHLCGKTVARCTLSTATHHRGLIPLPP